MWERGGGGGGGVKAGLNRVVMRITDIITQDEFA